MPDFFRIPNLIPLHAWLIEAGTNDVATETLFDGFCGRLAVEGVPIARGFLSIAGLHPLRRAYSLTWNYGRSVEATDFAHDTMATAVWQTSPFRTKRTIIHARSKMQSGRGARQGSSYGLTHDREANHAPAKRWRRPTSPIIEQASENP